MTAPVFLTCPLPDGDRVTLGGSEGRHAATVRRLGKGERIDLTDGAGNVARCVVVEAGRDQLELEVHARESVPAPSPRLVVIQALVKGDRSELAAELLTEVGVDEIVPWQSERSVAKWVAGRSERRWQQTVAEASKQARRTWWPSVGAVLTSAGAVATRIQAASCSFVLHEAAATALAGELAELAAQREVVLVVGPEGGITDAEQEIFEAAGASAVRLGPSVLRASTAGCAGSAVVLAAMGRWK